MKTFLFGKYHRLFSESTSAVWWNDSFIMNVRLLNPSPTPAVRLERLSYFHKHKITAFGVVLFLVTSLIAALLCSTLGVFSCLLALLAYGFIFAPFLLMIFESMSFYRQDKKLNLLDALQKEQDERFSYWAELLEMELLDPMAVVKMQMKLYQKLTAVLTFILVQVSSALLGTVVSGNLSGVGYAVLFGWACLLLFSIIFIFCPYYWLIQIKAQLEKRKSRRD